MRWIVTLVAAVCVASAGTGHIDAPHTGDRHVATLAPAPATSAAPAQRRDVRRDIPFVAAVAPEVFAPARTAIDASPRCVPSVSSPEAPAPCSRGPPRG